MPAAISYKAASDERLQDLEATADAVHIKSPSLPTAGTPVRVRASCREPRLCELLKAALTWAYLPGPIDPVQDQMEADSYVRRQSCTRNCPPPKIA